MQMEFRCSGKIDMSHQHTHQWNKMANGIGNNGTFAAECGCIAAWGWVYRGGCWTNRAPTHNSDRQNDHVSKSGCESEHESDCYTLFKTFDIGVV